MKIAHLLRFLPHSSGLYETAREFIQEECVQGHTARFVDCTPDVTTHKYLNDRGARSESVGFLNEADVVIIHQLARSVIVNSIKKPIIVMLHGTPRDCMWGELYERTRSYSAIYNLINDKRVIGFVSLWSEHLDFWSAIIPNEKLFYVPAPVDTAAFNPKGPKYEFKPNWSGKPNVVFADAWRIDKNPFELLHAYKLFKKDVPKARLHMYCKPSNSQVWDRFLRVMSDGRDDFYGEIDSGILDLSDVLRGCDFVITNVSVASRIIRECCALKVPFVGGRDCIYTKYVADHYIPDAYCWEMRNIWSDLQGGTLLRDPTENYFSLENSTSALIENISELLSRNKKLYEKNIIT